MADSNENNTQNQEQSGGNNTAADKEAVAFDEMTVLSRGEAREGMDQADNAAGRQAQVEGDGNENIQSDVAKKDEKVSGLLRSQNIKKTIYITGRIINFVV